MNTSTGYGDLVMASEALLQRLGIDYDHVWSEMQKVIPQWIEWHERNLASHPFTGSTEPKCVQACNAPITCSCERTAEIAHRVHKALDVLGYGSTAAYVESRSRFYAPDDTNADFPIGWFELQRHVAVMFTEELCGARPSTAARQRIARDAAEPAEPGIRRYKIERVILWPKRRIDWKRAWRIARESLNRDHSVERVSAIAVHLRLDISSAWEDAPTS